MARKGMNVGGENPEFILREFEGMNVLDAREAINDDEFAWCENAIPVGSGALYPLPAPAPYVTVSGESGAPSYAQNFNANGIDYVFAVWASSGNGWIVSLAGGGTTLIVTGLTSGQTSATQYGNQGLLIIDPTGYWDWNVTTPNVLTPQNGTLANATFVYQGSIAIGSSLRQVFNPATGTGGTFRNNYQVTNVVVNAAGTGYAVGDTLNLSDGNPTTPAQIVVATIGGSGNITGITLSTGGSYPGPSSSAQAPVGPTGNVVTTTGNGTGATFTGNMSAFSTTILTNGYGYPASTIAFDQFNRLAIFLTLTEVTVTSSGVIGGTAIATYAGRVWIALNRVVFFTDINSYYSFGGAGGSFTINDAYLHDAVTALFAANNYLYIFGDTSIDSLSNVTVNAGVTSFSRINITASVGTSTPTSIFSYFRSIIFYHASGFYLLSGATPEKISGKISSLVQAIVPSSTPGTDIPLVYGGQALTKGELCAVMLFSFTDTFTSIAPGGNRSIFAMFFRGRWCLYSGIQFGAAFEAMSSVSVSGVETLYAWRGPQLWTMLNPGTANAEWLIKTKLWDGGAPTREKQAINCGLAGTWTGLAPTGVTVNVDTELSTAVAQPVSTPVAGYQFEVTIGNEGGSQYLGLTVQGSGGMSQINMLALRGKTERDMMQ